MEKKTNRQKRHDMAPCCSCFLLLSFGVVVMVVVSNDRMCVTKNDINGSMRFADKNRTKLKASGKKNSKKVFTIFR